MNRHVRTPLCQRGFSLVELMIAVLLGLIVIAGLIQILIANRKAYQIQQGSNYLQQNIRYANDRIGWSLRMADFWGGVSAHDVQGLLGDGSGASGCDSTWILAGKPGGSGGGVHGYDGATSFPISGCVPDSDYVRGSDVIVMRYADTDSCDVADGVTNLSTNTCKPDSAYYLAAYVGQQASLFASGGSVPVFPGFSTSRYVYPYRVEMYYLQPCSDRGAGDACGAGSDGGTPQPTLMRMHLDSTGKMVREPIVDGIEQLQFEYEVVTIDGTGNITSVRYKSASQMAASEWENVYAVRVSMVSRNRERDQAVSYAGTFQMTKTCGYSISNSGTFTLSSLNDDCAGFSLGGLVGANHFVRRFQQQVVQIRNHIHSPG